MRAVESMRMYAILNPTLAYELDSDGRVVGGIRSNIFNLVQSLINFFFNLKKYLDATNCFFSRNFFFKSYEGLSNITRMNL